jgi:thiosulfate/3-mercaptopyruvate sulfurtransferase
VFHKAIVAGACALLACAAVSGMADTGREALLVSTNWLAAHERDANLVLLHVGEKTQYDKEHIPGARFVSLKDVSAPSDGPNGLTLEMAAPEILRSELEAIGVSDNSHVVVYYGKDWVSPSTRLLITLLYAGLQNVSLLDGGMDAWTKDGHEVTDVVPSSHPGTLKPLHVKPLVVDAEFVRQHTNTPGFAIVDARNTEFFNGSQEGGPRDHRKAGHIPGARSVPFSELTTPDLRVKSSDALADVFSKAGVRPGDAVIAYCHIGQQATATLFGALLLGHPILLYDGSFEDWARRDLPVDNPTKND